MSLLIKMGRNFKRQNGSKFFFLIRNSLFFFFVEKKYLFSPLRISNNKKTKNHYPTEKLLSIDLGLSMGKTLQIAWFT